MRTYKTFRSTTCFIAVTSLAACGFAFAQDAPEPPAAPDQAPQAVPAPPPPPPDQPNPAPNSGWRRASDPAPVQDAQPAPPPFVQRPNYSEYPNYSNQGPGPQGQAPNAPPPQPAVPAQLTIKAGTFVTVRVNQPLSSDHNHPGDAFTATLVRPIVVDGVIVAQRGQTIAGVVKDAQKAGRVEGVSKLQVQLTDLTLVDGQQMPIQSQLLTRNGDTSVGRDVAGVATTTGVGAAIGAAVNGGVGAGVGAGAGLIVGTIGVLLTRGRPTYITPESVLTFRVEAPVAISTERAPYAFRYVDPNEYDRPDRGGPQLGYRPPPGPGVAPYGYPYYAGYPYYYPYWGPGWGFGVYPSFYFGRGFYGRGYYGWRR